MLSHVMSHRIAAPKTRRVAAMMAGAAAVMLLTATASALPIIRGTGDAALIGNDLTDLGNNGVEASYTYPAGVFPANLGGFDAVFFASSEANFSPVPTANEGAFNVFDNLTGGGSNKWCCEAVTEATDGVGVFVGADFSLTLAAGTKGIVLNRFTMTTSNDTPGRDPDVWAIQGSNDGTTWTNIYTTSVNLFTTTRDQVFEFSVANGDFALPPAFDMFRLFVDSTAGAGIFALGELELFGDIIDIPEPANATLGLLALGSLLLRRRRTA